MNRVRFDSTRKQGLIRCSFDNGTVTSRPSMKDPLRAPLIDSGSQLRARTKIYLLQCIINALNKATSTTRYEAKRESVCNKQSNAGHPYFASLEWITHSDHEKEAASNLAHAGLTTCRRTVTIKWFRTKKYVKRERESNKLLGAALVASEKSKKISHTLQNWTHFFLSSIKLSW